LVFGALARSSHALARFSRPPAPLALLLVSAVGVGSLARSPAPPAHFARGVVGVGHRRRSSACRYRLLLFALASLAHKGNAPLAIYLPRAHHRYFISAGLATVVRGVSENVGQSNEMKLCDVAVTKLCTGELFGEDCVKEDSLGLFPSTIVCETAVRVYRLDKAQINVKRWQEEQLAYVLKLSSVRYPEDCILLQMFLDTNKNAAQKEKTMKQLEKTLKKRDRKDDKKMKKMR
jgi:hypothetical protein